MSSSRVEYYRCPECRAALKWSINNFAIGAEGAIICTNNVTASRLDLKWNNVSFCTWTGIARRTSEFEVKLFHEDGSQLRPYLIEKY